MTAIIDGTNGVTTPNVLTSSSGVALTLQSGGTTAVTIDTSQNVGVGTTSPSSPIDVVSNSSAVGITLRGRSSESTGKINFVNNANSTTYAALQTNSGEFSVNAVANIPINFYTNNTSRMTLNTSGSLVFATSGQGVQFTNSSALTNSTLNDYETGTWTPTLTSYTNSYTSVSYTRQYGRYTKIGNLVYAMFDMATSGQTVGSATSDLLIAGFPFTMANTGVADSYSGSIGFSNGLATSCSGLLQASAFNRVYLGVTSGGTLAVSTQGASGFSVRATICYQATF